MTGETKFDRFKGLRDGERLQSNGMLDGSIKETTTKGTCFIMLVLDSETSLGLCSGSR